MPAKKRRTQHAVDVRIRRLAEKAGYRACRSRWRRGSVDNLGGWQVINDANYVVNGEHFDLTDEEVTKWLEGEVAATEKEDA